MIALDKYVTESKNKYFNLSKEELNNLQNDADNFEKVYKNHEFKLKDDRVPSKGFKAEEGKRYMVVFKNPFKYDDWVKTSKDTERGMSGLPDEPEMIYTIGIGDKYGRVMLPLLWERVDKVWIQYGNDKFDKNKEWNITRCNMTDVFKTSFYFNKPKESPGVGIFISDKAKETSNAYNIPLTDRYHYETKFNGNKNKYLELLVPCEDVWIKVMNEYKKQLELDNIKKAEEDIKNKKRAERQQYWDKVYKEYENIGMLNLEKSISKEHTEWMKDSEAWVEYSGPLNGDHTVVSDKYKAYYSYCSAD